MGIAHFKLVKLESLTAWERKLRLWHFYLEEESQCQKSGYYSDHLDDSFGASPWSFCTSRHCCRNSREKLQQGFIIIRMRSYLLKEQLHLQSTGTPFCLFLWSNNQLLSKFYYLLIISPCHKFRRNSSHCQLTELFQSKESFKEKADSDSNWKTAWPRMILECHLFLRLSLEFKRKILSFVGNNLSFNLKYVCSFSVFFYLNEEELIQLICLIKYIENEISNSTSQKNKRKEQKHTATSKSSFLKLLKKCHYLH